MAARLKSLTPELTPLHKFGAELRRLRIRAGMSQPQLASALYTSKSTVSRAETGVRLLAPDLVESCDTLVQAKGLLVSAWRVAACTNEAGDSSAPTTSCVAAATRCARTARESRPCQQVARCRHGRGALYVRYRCAVPLTCPPTRRHDPRLPDRGRDGGWDPQEAEHPGLPGRSSAGASVRAVSRVRFDARGCAASLLAGWRRSSGTLASAYGGLQGVVSDSGVPLECRTDISRSPPRGVRGRPPAPRARRMRNLVPPRSAAPISNLLYPRRESIMVEILRNAGGSPRRRPIVASV